MDKQTVEMVESTVLDSLKVMDIPEGILKSCKESRQKFDDIMARRLCLSTNENIFEGFKQAVNEYLKEG